MEPLRREAALADAAMAHAVAADIETGASLGVATICGLGCRQCRQWAAAGRSHGESLAIGAADFF